MKHFISILDTPTDQLLHILKLAADLRDQRRNNQPNPPLLAGKTLAMYFEKPSLRTRVSFEQAMYELAGHAIVLDNNSVQLGQRESVGDFARVMSGMVHAIMARVYEHEKLIEMTQHASVPIINALSDLLHPCQALADALTLQDEFGPDLANRTLTFVGDGNNVARSLAAIAAKLNFRFILASPPAYALAPDDFDQIRSAFPDAQLLATSDPIEAVKQADAVYCDTFVSMGQEDEKQRRLKDFQPFQVNDTLLAHAPDHAIVMHCLPAYRNIEITDAALDGPQSRAFSQAHNRLHAQKALLAVLLANA